MAKKILLSESEISSVAYKEAIRAAELVYARSCAEAARLLSIIDLESEDEDESFPFDDIQLAATIGTIESESDYLEEIERDGAYIEARDKAEAEIESYAPCIELESIDDAGRRNARLAYDIAISEANAKVAMEKIDLARRIFDEASLNLRRDQVAKSNFNDARSAPDEDEAHATLYYEQAAPEAYIYFTAREKNEARLHFKDTLFDLKINAGEKKVDAAHADLLKAQVESEIYRRKAEYLRASREAEEVFQRMAPTAYASLRKAEFDFKSSSDMA